VAAKIVAHKADLLLALKGNHPVLEKEIDSFFDTAPAQHGRMLLFFGVTVPPHRSPR
jgi:hypothetical protein